MGARALPRTDVPFWRRKTLEQMTPDEWESLCDGCGRCCLVKLEDDDTGEVFLTSVACSLLDPKTCRCSDYPNRFSSMPDCISVTPQAVRTLAWLPETCAYRLVHEGKDLYWWHPLQSGDSQTVAEAGISVGDWTVSEAKVATKDLDRYIVTGFDEESGSKGPVKEG